MAHRLLVITLSRTPERLRAFYKNNKNVLVDWNVERSTESMDTSKKS